MFERRYGKNTYNYISYLQNRCGHPWENKIQRKRRGEGEAQLRVPGHFGRSWANAGKCFEAPRARPLITGSGGSLKTRKEAIKTQKWRSVDGDWWIEEGTSHQPDFIVPISFFQCVCMNGLLITHHADIILMSPALLFFIPLGLAHWSLRGKYGYRRFTQDVFITSAL